MTQDEMLQRLAGTVHDELGPGSLMIEPMMCDGERSGSRITYRRSKGRRMRTWQFEAIAEFFGALECEVSAEDGRVVVHLVTLEMFDFDGDYSICERARA